MRILKLALTAVAATAALSSTAFAADLLMEPQPEAAPIIDNTVDWNGAYLGVLVQGQSAPAAFGLGLDFGVNALMNNLLIGGELEAVASTGGNGSLQGTAKIGGNLGDVALAYVYTGLGTRTVTGAYVPVGIGAEFRLADNLGLKTDAQYNFDLSGPGQNSAAVKVGLNWHF